MTVVVFTNSSWGLPLLNELLNRNSLKGIVTPYMDHQDNERIALFAKVHKIPFIKVKKGQLHHELKEWLLGIAPEVVFCMTFPYLIPKSLLDIPQYGFVNFHFGKLPEYSGADPLFWALKENKKSITISIHKMGLSFDTGILIHEMEIPIIPGENWGILGSRLSVLSSSLVPRIFDKIKNKNNDPTRIPKNENSRPVDYDDLIIDWANQSSDEIESLINACNPKYGGAITYFRGSLVRILEVSPAELNNTSIFFPGGIVYSDVQNGIFVLCSDYKFLRINFLRTPEAFLTGFKLAALGIQTGEKFYKETPVQV